MHDGEILGIPSIGCFADADKSQPGAMQVMVLRSRLIFAYLLFVRAFLFLQAEHVHFKCYCLTHIELRGLKT